MSSGWVITNVNDSHVSVLTYSSKNGTVKRITYVKSVTINITAMTITS